MAAIYDMDGYALSQGLQGCSVCDEALIYARELARDSGECVLLSDDDGEWIVCPNGTCREYNDCPQTAQARMAGEQ